MLLKFHWLLCNNATVWEVCELFKLHSSWFIKSITINRLSHQLSIVPQCLCAEALPLGMGRDITEQLEERLVSPRGALLVRLQRAILPAAYKAPQRIQVAAKGSG